MSILARIFGPPRPTMREALIHLSPDTSRLFDSASAVADAGGIAVIVFAGPPVGYSWRIGIISVSGGLPAGLSKVYVGSAQPGNMVDVGPAPDANTDDRTTKIYVPESMPLTVAVQATPGDYVTVRIEGTVQRALG